MENSPPPADKRQDALTADQAPLESLDEPPETTLGDIPPPADYDTLERQRFGPLGFVPSSPWLTVALCLGFVGLLIYGVVSGNALAFALVAVVAVFVGVPYLLLYLFNGRQLPPRNYAPLVDDVEQWHPGDAAGASPTEESLPGASRESLDGALPAAKLGEPSVGNGHITDI